MLALVGDVASSPADGAVQVPGYVVGERLGAGGFGEVFRARHVKLGREVAIKVLHPKYSADPQAVARFVSEARAVTQISHPGIVDVFDFGELADGRQYCVMELIEGTTLRDLLRERTRLPLAEALPILRGIADAVDAAHAAGIAHRDLKPDNVFVLPDGSIKLIDFGLAKLTTEADAPVTQTGSVFGTPLYMSPEQCRGKAIDTRTDLYSFGVLAYQVLTGEPPFSGDALELALHHLNDEPPAPSSRCADLDTRVDRVLLALLAKEPADRPMPLRSAIDTIVGDGALPRRRRVLRTGRWVLAAALAGSAVSTIVAVRGCAAPADTDVSCDPGEARLDGIWDPATRARIKARFDASRVVHVPGSWNAVALNLDPYAPLWSAQWDAACRSTDRQRDPLLYAQRETCLDNALIALRAITTSLAEVEIDSFSEAFTGNFVLPRLDDCESTAVLRAQVPAPPPEQRAEVARLLGEVHRARAEVRSALNVRRTKDIDAGLARLEETAVKLEALGSPAAADASVWRAGYLVRRAVDETDSGIAAVRVATAREVLATTIRRAEAGRNEQALLAAYLHQLVLERSRGSGIEILQDILARADATLSRAGKPEGLAASVAIEHAELETRTGRFAQAIETLRAAIPGFERSVHVVDGASPRERLARLLARVGRDDDSVREAELALELQLRTFGPDHPMLAAPRFELEAAHARKGDLRAALADADEAIALHRRLKSHPSFVELLLVRSYGYALRLGDQGRADAARAQLLELGSGAERTAGLANSMGVLEVFADAATRLAAQPGRLSRAGVEDVQAWAAYVKGDRAGVRTHGTRMTTASTKLEPILDGQWLFLMPMSPWLLATLDALEGLPGEPEARLAALAPFGSTTDTAVKSGAITLNGFVWAGLGRWTEARAAFEAARALPVWSPDYNLAEISAWLGMSRVETGDPQAAISSLEDSLQILAECCQRFHYFAPIAELALARALWDTGGDKTRARWLAEQARDHFARLGPFKEPERQQAIRWLAEHPAS